MMRYIVLILCLIGFSMLNASELVSYQESLDKFISKSKSTPSKFSKDDRVLMQKEAESLAKFLPSPGIKVGNKAPDFSLKNAFGKEVSLYSELKKGPVILVFYRGAWCPFCNMHLHTLQDSLDSFKKYKAQLITITPQTPDKSTQQIKKDGYPFEVLSDLDDKVMKDYNLYFKLSKELDTLYKNKGLDIESFNGKNRIALPVPGSFVIDTNGVIRAMQADTDYMKRMEPKAIIEALKEISKGYL